MKILTKLEKRNSEYLTMRRSSLSTLLRAGRRLSLPGPAAFSTTPLPSLEWPSWLDFTSGQTRISADSRLGLHPASEAPTETKQAGDSDYREIVRQLTDAGELVVNALAPLPPISGEIQATADNLTKAHSSETLVDSMSKIRERIAYFITQKYQLRAQPRHTLLTNGINAAIDHLLEVLLTNSSHHCLAISPTDLYNQSAVSQTEGRLVLAKGDKHGSPDLGDLSKKLAAYEYPDEQGRLCCAVRVIIFNPVGGTTDTAEAQKIADFMNKLNQTYHGGVFTIGLTHSVADPNYSILNYLTGQAKINSAMVGNLRQSTLQPHPESGYIFCQNRQVMSSLLTMHQANSLSVSPLVQKAASGFVYNETQDRETANYYNEKRARLIEGLNQIMTKYGLPQSEIASEPDGGLFILADLSVMIGRPVPKSLQGYLGKEIVENDQDIARYLRLLYLTPGAGASLVVLPGSESLIPQNAGMVRICVAGENDTSAAEDRVISKILYLIDTALRLQTEEINDLQLPGRTASLAR